MSLPARLLLVDDDLAFCQVLARLLQRRGVEVRARHDAASALAALDEFAPEGIVLDLKLGADNGLLLIRDLRERCPQARIVLATGYASIATAVEAIKLGACHYLAKPSNTDDIEAAFGRAGGDATVELTERQTSIKTLEWERIHEMLAETDFNISETARRLGMHRRTLARKLGKHRVK